MASVSLQRALEAGSIIAGENDEKFKGASGGGEQEVLLSRLQARLRAFDLLCDRQNRVDKTSLLEVQNDTGDAALESIILIEQAARSQTPTSSSSPNASIPIFGSRDLKLLSTLSSIIASWKIGLSIARYDKATSSAFSKAHIPKLQEIDENVRDEWKAACIDFATARQDVRAIMHSLEKLLETESTVRTQVLSTCSLYVLAAGIRLGWGPSAPGGRSKPDGITQHSREFVNSLLRMLPTSYCLKLLSSAASVGGKKSAATWVRSTTEMLFAAQLLRPDGVMSLLRNTFDAGDDNERGLMKKLVSIGQLLSTPPHRMPIEQFATIITPRILEIIGPLPYSEGELVPSQHSSSSQKNAAAFALARLNEVAHDAVFHSLKNNIFRFLDPAVSAASPLSSQKVNKVATSHDQLTAALDLLAEVVNQSEPSSGILIDLLRPVIIPLFVLSDADALLKAKVRPITSKGKGKADDELRKVAKDLFRAWLRLAETNDSMSVFSPQRPEGLFKLDSLPPGALSDRAHEDSFIPLLESADDGLQIVWTRAEEVDDTHASLAENLMDVQLDSEDVKLPTELLASLHQRPSPVHLAGMLKDAQRKDVASALLVELLDAYTLSRQAKVVPDEDGNPLRGVLYIQHILQLIDAFGADCLQGDKAKILTFVVFALGGKVTQSRMYNSGALSEKETEKKHEGDIPFITPNMQKDAFTKLVNLSDPAEVENEGSDKIVEDLTGDDDADEEMIETALSLLLSLLESDLLLTVEKYSLLHVITDRVQQLTTIDNAAIRSLAKEAGLVLKARKSSGEMQSGQSMNASLSTPEEQALSQGRAMYQEALKLLQDPILPVRAHGLVVLTQLVSLGSVYSPGSPAIMDPALNIAILDIFIQAICDDESFLYLNAVKGLAQMGNTGGKSLVRRLMAIYLASDGQRKVTQAEVDKRLRVGEAILQVVQKLDQALAAYVSDIVAPLLTAIRDSKTPTTLRTSMLSILGTCIEACPAAMTLEGHSAAICDAMLDLLSVESDVKGVTDQRDVDNALETNTKLPNLRRAALLLLSLLLRGSSLRLQHQSEQRQSDSWDDGVSQLSALRMPGGSTIRSLPKGSKIESQNADLLFPLTRLQRLHTVVSYVAKTDSDALSRHQAEEVLQDSETLKVHAIHSGQLFM